MDINDLEKFTQKNQSALQDFFQKAHNSREGHLLEDRILALEMMTCAIAASLEGVSRENFLTIMNSYVHANNPMKKRSHKSVADLFVLSSDFLSTFNNLKNK